MIRLLLTLKQWVQFLYHYINIITNSVYGGAVVKGLVTSLLSYH